MDGNYVFRIACFQARQNNYPLKFLSGSRLGIEKKREWWKIMFQCLNHLVLIRIIHSGRLVVELARVAVTDAYTLALLSWSITPQFISPDTALSRDIELLSSPYYLPNASWSVSVLTLTLCQVCHAGGFRWRFRATN